MIRYVPPTVLQRIPSFINELGASIPKPPYQVFLPEDPSLTNLINYLNVPNDVASISDVDPIAQDLKWMEQECANLLNRERLNAMFKNAGLAAVQSFFVGALKTIVARYIFDKFGPETGSKIIATIDYSIMAVALITLICKAPALASVGAPALLVSCIGGIIGYHCGSTVGNYSYTYLKEIPTTIVQGITNFFYAPVRPKRVKNIVGSDHQHGDGGYLHVRSCLICYERPANVIFSHKYDNNAHACLCQECSDLYTKNDICPGCNAECQDTYALQVYDVHHGFCSECVYVGICGVCRGIGPNTTNNPHCTASCYAKTYEWEDSLFSLCPHHLKTSDYEIKGRIYPAGE
jgi:hypothetical protein